MKLATIRIAGGIAVARIEGEQVVVLDYPDLAALLAHRDWQQRAGTDRGRTLSLAEADFASLVAPIKVICVGLNYRTHILEMRRELPAYPTLFGKFADTLTARGRRGGHAVRPHLGPAISASGHPVLHLPIHYPVAG